jgi:hypothetical protein
VRDVHNYTAWRDGFDPALAGLLAELAGAEPADADQAGAERVLQPR